MIEKRWTTPDQYPLSLNALRMACNQLTNRDPVTDYDEMTVREAAERLSRYGLTRLASGHGSRAVKYRHLAEGALSLGREELAVLAVLLLRGPQTPGELKARTERMASLQSLTDVERVLDTLIGRGYARRSGRRPGQKEDRFEQLLGGDSDEEAPPPESRVVSSPPPESGVASNPTPESGVASSSAVPPADAAGRPPIEELVTRLAALEDEVSALREEVSMLRGHRTDLGVAD